MTAKMRDEEYMVQASDELVKSMPGLFQTMASEIALITGQQSRIHMTGSQLDEQAKQRMLSLLRELQQLDKLNQEPLARKTANERIATLKRIIRLGGPGIPRNRNPIDWIMEAMQSLNEVPGDVKSLPQGLDYSIKHLQLKEFVSEVVASTDKTDTDAFLKSAISERKTISTYQRAYSNILFPKSLRRLPKRATTKSVERLKLGMHEVLTDWEALLNVIYGLYRLKQQKDAGWASIQAVSLWNKVSDLRGDPHLAPIAKQEWVTTRNALNHGSAFFDKNARSIIFADRKHEHSWTLEHTVFEGQDVYLSNLAMLHIDGFARTETIPMFQAYVAYLSEIATGHHCNTMH